MSCLKLIFSLCSTLLIIQGVSAQTPRFEVKYSEPLAVFMFVDQLSSKHSDNSYKQLFANSVYNREKYTQLLAQFDTLLINYTYEFQEYPYASKLPGMTETLLKKNLIASANLKEFKKRSAGIIPTANLLKLSTILYEFQPIYRELVYQPIKSKFEKQVIEIGDYVKSKNLSVYFDKGLSFYKAYWDEGLPFEIAFYPIPANQGFTADAFCNAAVCGLKTDYKEYNMIMGVIMHEVFHILYNEQSIQVKNDILNWFNSSTSAYATYAYLLMNEVFATALGNGYVYESLNGKKDEADWYNRKYIDQMAKKIYPLLNEYATQKKAIDNQFVSSYILVYEESFPLWLNEMDNLMCYRYVLSDNVSDFKLINKLYPYSSLSQYEDAITDFSIDRMKPCAITKMIIVSKNNEEKLELIRHKFPELKEWKYKAKSDFMYHCLLQDKTQLIIINNVKSSTEKELTGRVFLPQEATK